MKVKTKGKVKPKTTVVNFKVTTDEKRRIQAKAKMFFDGNVSLLLRKASLAYTPE